MRRYLLIDSSAHRQVMSTPATNTAAETSAMTSEVTTCTSPVHT